MRNPDKWIRKAFSELITVNGISTVWDMDVTGGNYPKEYILLTSQTKVDNRITKCGGQWDCTIMVDIVTRYIGSANTGSRVRVNDIEESLMIKQNLLSIEHFSIFSMHVESSDSQDSSSNTEQIFRQLMRYRLILREVD